MLKQLAVISSIVMVTGCATLITDNAKSVNVATNTGKKIDFTVDDQRYTSPTVVKFVKDGKDKVIATEDGNCAEKTVASKKVEPAFFGNIIIGGILGSTTDAVGNKMWTYEDNVIISCSE